ncbi:hypothetical protein [Amycolatopsis sp. La24]|uniref:hypothetical protein n=1 Tax=Amycolatopsis sp. La24 TaxID=3028304 RepID=UPI0023B13F18|nr:hypothetical protein [Amycolatopsis sp. La24]
MDPGIARWYGQWTRARELGAAEVVAFAEARNARSCAVVERLGYHWSYSSHPA